MKFGAYLESRIFSFLSGIFLLFFIGVFLLLFNISVYLILILELACFFILITKYFIQYYFLKKRYLGIVKIADELEETYYISEMLPKPKMFEELGYYYAFQKSLKKMNERVYQSEKKSEDYEKFITSFVHDIKTPLSSISLMATNLEHEKLKGEVLKIDAYVEQILYYARIKNPEKDYFVEKVNMENFIQELLIQYKDSFSLLGVELQIHDINYEVYTDTKWVLFILKQILGNSLKYFKNEKKVLEIFGEKKENSIQLSIKDNGIGIPFHDLKKVFEYGFTGSNRNNKNSTGIGLYLAKESANKLGLGLKITSKENEYTQVTLEFPIGHVHNF